MTAHKGTEWRTTVHDNDTIVLVAGHGKKAAYSGSDGFGLPCDYFILDECGPFPIERGKRLVIHRDADGVFDSFEWMDI